MDRGHVAPDLLGRDELKRGLPGGYAITGGGPWNAERRHGAAGPAIKALIRRMDGFAEKLGKMQEEAWDITDTVKRLMGEATLPDLQRSNIAQLRTLLRERRKKPLDLVAKRNAEKGVEDVKITREADGHARVRIAGLHEITLAPRLADLLEILCVDTGSNEEDFVSWKKWTEIARLLGKKATRKGKHAVRNLAWRLQMALHGGGYNRYWVQRNESGDLRFALKREPKEVVIK